MKTLLLLGLLSVPALPGFAMAEYKVCGKFIECGVFGAVDFFERNGEVPSISIYELEPSVITFIAKRGNDPFGDDMVFTLRFDEDGHFKLNFWRYMQIGEGSCQNMVCQFRLDDSDWSIYAEPKRPALQVSGTLSFANGYISRTEVRKLGDATPFFFTGALGSLCADESFRQKLTRPGGVVTEESCSTFYEMRAKLALGVKRK